MTDHAHAMTSDLVPVDRRRLHEMMARGFSVVSVRDEHSVWMSGGSLPDRGWQPVGQPAMRVLHHLARKRRQ